MPSFNHSNNIQITGSEFTDIGRDAYFHYGDKETVLEKLKRQVATGALHNSGERFDPPKCHPGTRIAVLKRIQDWYKDTEPSTPPVMWLYGAAGAGKSAIAQSTAEECHKLRTLGGSFFFSRKVQDRNDAAHLIATIAYQVAQEVPDAQPFIQKALQNDPVIFSKSIESQLRHLVIDPLSNIERGTFTGVNFWPKLIIIDGLDECDGRGMQQAIVRCFASELSQKTLPLRVLIASRPEQPIRDVFCRVDRGWAHVSLALNDEYQPDEDITLFLRCSFSDIRGNHVSRISLLEPPWPSDDDIKRLVKKSSGQFIFASTIIKYIESPCHHPRDRLQTVLGIQNFGSPTPFAELDALYMHILKSTSRECRDAMLRIFGFILCGNPGLSWRRTFRVPDLEDFLSLGSGRADLALVDCHSIVQPQGNSGEIKFLHASMSDFLLDQDRSHDFHVNQANAHTELVRACMKGVKSSNRKVQFFSSNALTWHCQNAYIDRLLLDDLLCFDLSQLYQINPLSRVSHWDDFYVLCFHQISWIKEQALKKGFYVPQEKLDAHVSTTDRHIKNDLCRTQWPDQVSELYALAHEIEVPGRGKDDLDAGESALLLLGIDPGRRKTIYGASRNRSRKKPEDTFCKTFAGIGKTMEPVQKLLKEFLHNQKRAGNYYIGQEVYARVALRCMKFLWKYRRIPNLANSYIDGESRRYHSHEVEAVHKSGLETLPYLLSLAAPLRELAESLRSEEGVQFPEIAGEIILYLKRYDEWEKRESPVLDETEKNPRITKRPRDVSLEDSSLAETLAREIKRRKGVTVEGTFSTGEESDRHTSQAPSASDQY